jgi:cytochrome c
MPISALTIVVSHVVFTAWILMALAPPPPGGERIAHLVPMASHVVAAPSDSTTVHPFTTEQAVRGEALYDEFCAECHGFDLAGEDAKPLAGDSFMNAWGKGKHTVDDLFYIVRTQMPYGDAGTLERQQYIDIIAYILSKNGYTAGDRELIPDADSLRSIVIRPQPGCPR